MCAAGPKMEAAPCSKSVGTILALAELRTIGEGRPVSMEALKTIDSPSLFTRSGLSSTRDRIKYGLREKDGPHIQFVIRANTMTRL